jgi:hypothetical protein
MLHPTLWGGHYFLKTYRKQSIFSNSQLLFFIDEQEVGCRPGLFMRSPIGVDAGSEFGPTPFW